MRRMMLWMLLAFAALALAGCSRTQEIENQAYALALGVDAADGGGLALTIRVPRVGNSKAGEGGDERSSPYLMFSGEGDTLAQTLEALQFAVPRELNLSHIKLLAASEAMAADARFPDVIDQLTQMPRLYANARFIVCEGAAKDFIGAQQTILTTRLSSEIDAMIDHYTDHGYIPETSLADVYYASHSFYSDPVAARGHVSPPAASVLQVTQAEPAEPTAALVRPEEGDAARPSESPSAVYAGAAVFRDGRLALRLDAGEALLLNLALGRRESFAVESGGRMRTLAPDGRPVKQVDLRDGGVTVRITVRLTANDWLEPEEARDIEARLAASLYALVKKCRDAGVEPFGFAECAAGGFIDNSAWEAYGWRERFSRAEIDARAELRCAGAK